MKRSWQIFVAPGEDSQQLPIDSSPWHDERWVNIPLEHWELILDFADTIDSLNAQKLRSLSFPNEENEYSYIYVSLELLKEILLFMEKLADKIKKASPLVPYPTEEIPDEYTNEEHIRMLNAVGAVFQETIKLKQPFRAWRE